MKMLLVLKLPFNLIKVITLMALFGFFSRPWLYLRIFACQQTVSVVTINKRYMKIISFGITKDITGSLFMDFDTGEKPISIVAFKEVLFEQYPALRDLKTLSFAINNAYANENTMVSNQDELALIPPVSGG